LARKHGLEDDLAMAPMNSQFDEVGSDHYKLTSVIAAAEILSQSDFFIFHLFQSKI
jgi:hypothetical protein